jgi:hypothetical protein
MSIGIAVLFFALGWHASGTWHRFCWRRDITRRAETLVNGVYRHPQPLEVIHVDQEMVELPSPPPSIKAICLDAHYGERFKLKRRA